MDERLDKGVKSPRVRRKAAQDHIASAQRDLAGQEGLDEGQRAERLAIAYQKTGFARNLLLNAKKTYEQG